MLGRHIRKVNLHDAWVVVQCEFPEAGNRLQPVGDCGHETASNGPPMPKVRSKAPRPMQEREGANHAWLAFWTLAQERRCLPSRCPHREGSCWGETV